MKKYLAAVAFVAALVQPASAITFSQLTTIYVITGVKDSGSAANQGHATAFQCSNVSGVSATIRFLILSDSGVVLASKTDNNVPHGFTIERSTHLTSSYNNETQLLEGRLSAGVANIESTQSDVFCTAAIIDAAAANPVGVNPHIIRVNPHPGSVE